VRAQSIAKDLPGSANRAQEYFLGHGSDDAAAGSSNNGAKIEEVQMAAMPSANATAAGGSASDGLKQRKPTAMGEGWSG
jgi:hypothetical protein